MILNVGAGGLVTTFRPILVALAKKFELKAAVIDPYFGLAAANTKLEEMGFISVATTALFDWIWGQHSFGCTSQGH